MNKVKEPDLSGWRVVVVDDEIDNLEIAKSLLQHYGAEVYTAENGYEGLEVIGQVQPQFVLSDLMMPQMDGWQMVDLLQKDRTTSDIPIIALTADNVIGNRQRAIGSGFINYLVKPLNVTTFITDILKLLVDSPTLKNALTETDFR